MSTKNDASGLTTLQKMELFGGNVVRDEIGGLFVVEGYKEELGRRWLGAADSGVEELGVGEKDIHHCTSRVGFFATNPIAAAYTG
ncbi:uncharacterized protein A4U43_C06F6860 [Asparagus officinalis]|uniref:Uncharacterized protein n=1 Tax=Asparagus officinalis TaxID=4686 RepID=A0A5P1EKP9_ASPOF|nr:uncharacterized protein A4U43_C06F6860 [Asparagus officinalis]